MTTKFHYIKSKKQANRILYRIYRHMESENCLPVRFFKKMSCFGGCSKYNVIVLNPYYSIVDTFIHEYLHYFYGRGPKYEKMICRMEKEMMYWISDLQIENLMSKFGKLIRIKHVCLSKLRKEFDIPPK